MNEDERKDGLLWARYERARLKGQTHEEFVNMNPSIERSVADRFRQSWENSMDMYKHNPSQ